MVQPVRGGRAGVTLINGEELPRVNAAAGPLIDYLNSADTAFVPPPLPPWKTLLFSNLYYTSRACRRRRPRRRFTARHRQMRTQCVYYTHYTMYCTRTKNSTYNIIEIYIYRRLSWERKIDF